MHGSCGLRSGSYPQQLSARLEDAANLPATRIKVTLGEGFKRVDGDGTAKGLVGKGNGSDAGLAEFGANPAIGQLSHNRCVTAITLNTREVARAPGQFRQVRAVAVADGQDRLAPGRAKQPQGGLEA